MRRACEDEYAATPEPKSRLAVERARLPDGRLVARYRHIDAPADSPADKEQ